MAVRLVVVEGPLPPGARRGAELPEDGLAVGRSEDNGWVLPDPSVSRHHFRIRCDGSGWYLEDQGSSAGTYVNGARVSSARLTSGDLILAGETRFRFDDDEALLPPLPAAAAPFRPPPSPPPPGPRPARPAKPTRSPRSLRTPLALGGAGALVLLLVVCLGGGSLYLTRGLTNLTLLPAILRSIAANGWAGRLNPEAPAKSGAPAVAVKTLPGVVVSAPKDALDKPRTIRVTPVDPAGALSLYRAALASREAPVAAFRVDAGMAPGERFPGEMAITLDLAKCGVPKELWPTARLYHLDAQGRAQEVQTVLKGGGLTGKAHHNEVFITTVGALIAGTAIGITIAAETKFEGGPWHSFAGPNIKVFWPARLSPRRPEVFNPVDQELGRLWDRYMRAAAQVNEASLEPGDRAGQALFALAQYLSDPRVKELRALLSDEEWLRENFVPTRVENGRQVMERCYTYLTAKRWRGFQEPTFKVDVLFRDPWSHGPDELAMTTGNYLLYPYIDLNLARIPDRPIDMAAADAAFDELHRDCVHELFHALQRTYYSGEPQAYDWFLEATAVVLELEASEEFKAVGFTSAGGANDRNAYLDAFFQRMDYTAGDVLARRHHGYGESYFLEALRDRYYKGAAAPQFLQKLMADFGSWGGAPVKSLVGVSSSSDSQFGEDFRTFCEAQASTLMAVHRGSPGPDGAAELTPESPLHRWKLTDHRPLSTRMLQLTLRQPPVRLKEGEVDPPAPMLLVRGNPREADKIYLRCNPMTKTWTAVSSKDVVLQPGAAGKRGVFGATLQRTEASLEVADKFVDKPKMAYPTPGAGRDAAYDLGESVESEVLALFSPPMAEEGKVTAAAVEVLWPLSGLAKKDLVLGYRITAEARGKSRKPLKIETKETRTLIDLEKLFGKEGPEPGDSIQVTYQERVKSDGEVWGPASIPLVVEIEDPFTGTWKGTITITREKVSDAVEGILVKMFGEDARSAVKRSGVVNTSNAFTLVVTPSKGGFFGKVDYAVSWSNEAREKWKPWQAKGEGALEKEALVVELHHPDGTLFVLTLRPAGKDRLEGTFEAGAWLLKDALSGTLTAARAEKKK